MLSTNDNQYLAFRTPQWTWWVYEWGAQVRQYKNIEEPPLEEASSSKMIYSHPIIYNQVPERH
jgi:hypothetical protein